MQKFNPSMMDFKMEILTDTRQIEAALIGSLLVDPEKIIAASEHIRLTDFQDERAQRAYAAILEEWKNHQPVNILTIAGRCPGMATWLAGASSNSFPPSVGRFAYDISESARMRRVKTGIEAAVKADNPQEILSGVMGIYQQEMRSGRKAPEIAAVVGRVRSLVKQNKQSGVLGFGTGFKALDSIYARFMPGHVWTIGGFTSVGKTATMVQMICNAINSNEGASTVIISTEMTEEQLVARVLSNLTGIPSYRILSGRFYDAEEADIAESAVAKLASASIAIYDDIYRLGEIEIALHKADLRGGVNLAVIDYVQNCRWPEAKSQYQEQSEIAKRFQQLAKDVRATLVCLSQVSNDVGRGNTDQLELKGAGEWAAVSDYGVMLTRHKTEKYRLKFELKKNRHGALTAFELEFKNEFTCLEERNN